MLSQYLDHNCSQNKELDPIFCVQLLCVIEQRTRLISLCEITTVTGIVLGTKDVSRCFIHQHLDHYCTANKPNRQLRGFVFGDEAR
jgi:hypothetical protein